MQEERAEWNAGASSKKNYLMSAAALHSTRAEPVYHLKTVRKAVLFTGTNIKPPRGGLYAVFLMQSFHSDTRYPS
jgi:hypothetical protein